MRNKILLVLLLIFFSCSGLLAQSFGNEWINYNWDYYKIGLSEDGIYRLTYSDLQNIGFPVTSINPRRIKLYHRGIEQAILISGENDSQFDPGDYLEFYGIRNNGELDSLLYEPFSSQPHPYYNLYSDSSSYFLTWDKSGLTSGKRMEFYQESNVGGLPAEPFHNQEILHLETSSYSLGIITGDYVSRSAFIEGEGWTGPLIQEGNFADYLVEGLTAQYTTGSKPSLELILAGRNSLTHEVEIQVGPNASGLRSLSTFQFTGFGNYYLDQELEWTDVSAGGEILIRISILTNGTPLSNVSISSAKITFPQQMDAESSVSRYFYLEENVGDKSFVSISNTPTNALLYDVTDRNNVIRIGYSGIPNQVEAIIRNTTVPRKLLVTSPNFKTPSVRSISMIEPNFSSSEYVIISHPKLMQSVGEVQDAVKEYATYRASPDGGGYDTLVVSVLDLYNQFSYGENTPLAIRNFMKWLDNNGNPEFLFLIGKALDIRENYYRNDPLSFSYGDLVPLGGQPASDAIYTQGLNGSSFEPGVATGRLTAFTPEDVINYLEKVKEKEAVPFDNLWQKKMLHLSGGKFEFELLLYENYVRGFESIASKEYYGGTATTISKNSASNVEFVDISEEINQGINIVTFFGHSAPGIIDIDVGVPSNPVYGYSNKGKYPTFFVNGCRSGDFFGDYISWGADWVLTPGKGATAFIAHTYFGFSSTLKNYNDTFYEIGFADSTYIKLPLGQIHKETGRKFLEDGSQNDLNINQVQQMILIGDPATRLFGTNIPDFSIDNTGLFTVPPSGEITTNTRSFNLGIIVENYGGAVSDSIEVTVRRTLPSGLILDLDTIRFSPVYFTDTLFYEISNESLNVEGNNRLEVFINPQENIPEHTYDNNTAILGGLNIPAGATLNLFPYPYAFLDPDGLKLSAQSADPLSESRVFLFELDTTRDFSSPSVQRTSVSAQLLAQWEPLIEVQTGDTVTYYWRTKFQTPLEGEIDSWSLSSFSVASGVESGWAQLEFDQFRDNTFQNIEIDTISRSYDFEETQAQIFVQTFGVNNPDFDNTDVVVDINNVPYIIEGRFCRNNTLNLIAFDKATSVPYLPIFETVNSPRTCGRQVQVINNLTTADITGTADFLNRYIEEVKENDPVVLFSIGSVDYDLWPIETLNNLESFGIDISEFTSSISPGDPFIIVGKKGSLPGEAEIILATEVPADEQIINLNKQILGKLSNGTISSNTIGPGFNWNTLHTKAAESGGDQALFDVSGLNEGQETLLISDINPGQFDLSSIDSDQNPTLKLKMKLSDELDLTPPILDKWIVIYESPGEGILLFRGNDRNNALNNSIIEGESITSEFGFVNISDRVLSDSLTVRTTRFNNDSRLVVDSVKKILSPLPADTTFFTDQIISNGLLGDNDYTVNVNPDGEVPELNTFNNRIQFTKYFTVIEDEVNPVVEVFFDGLRIFDGDIVSPTPNINIKIRDENEFLLKEDTTGINILIRYPEEEDFRRINFTEGIVQWKPATSEEPFEITVTPDFQVNGNYTLSVQATDASGNKAGSQPFEINFEVVNESTITHFYPYPNPFSSSTRFVFTLTGREVPEEMKIQIMTISGKIVREITQDEIGLIRIGNNITEYAWDGKDEFGDQLANGVYLYRVFARIGGEEVDHRDSAGDKGFKKGFGKIYLLR